MAPQFNTRLLTVVVGVVVCCSKQSLSSVFVPADTPGNIVYPVRVAKRVHEDLPLPCRTQDCVDKRRKRHTLIENNLRDANYEEYNVISDDGETTLPEIETSRDDDEEYTNGANSVNPNEDIYVRIENEDEDLFLQLRPNRNLRTSGTVIEWVLPGGTTVLKTSPEDCYLVGNSVGEEGSSLVAVSSCSGLTGYIQTSKNSYFIEPLKLKYDGNGHRSDTKHDNYTDDFIKRYRDRTFQNTNKYFDSIDNTTDDEARIAYQHQRSYQEILTLPEPHVIYKVNTILERLNITLHDDQKFKRNTSSNTQQKVRRKRSPFTDVNRSTLSTANHLNKGRGRKRTNAARNNRRRKPKKGSANNGRSLKKLRRRRKRRHNRRRREMCRHLQGIQEVTSAASPTPTRQECLAEEQRRISRREERSKRRQNNRHEKARNKKARRKAREKRKRERKARKNDRNRTANDIGPNDGWSRFNLTGKEWSGGYSPGLPWELAQPAHSATIIEEDLSDGAVHRNRTAVPKRWLEVTVAVDNSVIDFHGEQNTERYVFTLFNIVSAIYQDPSLGATLDLVLLRLICYTDPRQSQVRAGEAKASLEAVNRWASRLYHASQPTLQHDMAVWLTRQPLGGPSGYAPVGGVCHSSRSCTLNRDEGLTSAFIIAHEMGHVLGLTHDGDTGSANHCVSEGVAGSVMAPLVAATFTSFHWSRCSRAEYWQLVSGWDCMLSPPSWVNATTVSPVVSYHYSLDEQCRMEFGEGFGLCQSYGLSDSCSHLWCSNSSTPYFCKTKKGPPLEGTVCGQGKWCRYGVCTTRGSAYHPIDDNSSTPDGDVATSPAPRKPPESSPVRHNPQHGGWSSWSDWGPCSVTCGPGVAFRTRACDNPKALWGGRRCRGKDEEWRVCGSDVCLEPSDVRAEHCSRLANIVQLDDRRAALNWLPYEPKSRRNKCRVSCFSRSTNEMFLGQETLRDGAPCSYDSPAHNICVQGKCVALGCDLLLGSGRQEDECGECGGRGETCATHTRTYYDTPLREYALVTVLPKGARKIIIRERENTTNFLALAERRLSSDSSAGYAFPTMNSSAGFLFPTSNIAQEAILLNPSKKQGPARSFVSEGTRFHYRQWGEKEAITARGPLLYEVAILIHGGSVTSPVHVTSTYSLQEYFSWEARGLGPCTATCGGGEQLPLLVCRNTVTGLQEQDVQCRDLMQPYRRPRPCNTFSCSVTWQADAWEHCSATCGNIGVQQRVVSCASVHEPLVPIDPLYCSNSSRPHNQRDCNRAHCPAHWHLVRWTECTGECGKKGHQKAVWSCPYETEEATFDCGSHPELEDRICYVECLEEEETRIENTQGDESPLISNTVGNSDDRRRTTFKKKLLPVTSTTVSPRLKNRRRNYTEYWHHSSSRQNSAGGNSHRRSQSSYHRRIVNGNSEVRSKFSTSTTDSSFKDPNKRRQRQFHFRAPDQTIKGNSRNCVEDASKLCRLLPLQHYCQLPGFRQLCCFACTTLL